MPNEPRYRLRELIARGGMAEVFRAEDLSREPPVEVAIKRILEELASDPTLARLFEDEAAVLARFDHPCIARLLDVGVQEGRAFHALELVDGPDAGSVLLERPFPPELALHVAERAASALAYAHGLTDDGGDPLDIVHRDVSPSNVLCGRDGRVVITDFGIALGKDRRERTATGMTKGKAAYMSPEQTLGAKVDARADVFALGCTLHALVAGKSPLAEPDAMAGLLAGEKVPLAPSLPADVRAIIERAIAPRAAARYPTMGAMHEALKSALSARGVLQPSRALAAFLAPLEPFGRSAGADPSAPTKPSAPSTAPSAGPASGEAFDSLSRDGSRGGSRRAKRLFLMFSAGGLALIAAALVVGLTSMDLSRPDAIGHLPTPLATNDGTAREAPAEAAPHAAPRATAAETPPSPPLAAVRPMPETTTPRPPRVERPDETPIEAPIERPIETPTVPAEAPAETRSAAWGVVNFRLPREARVSLDGGRTPFRDVTRGHPCDTTGLCHLPVGRHALVITLPDGTRETASLCVSEGSTTRVISPLPGDLGCD